MTRDIDETPYNQSRSNRVLSAEGPFYRVCIDTIGPFPHPKGDVDI